jgi:amidase
MLGDWQSTNAIYGRTNNPWDLGRTPGGSSGGSAAAIAAGLSALEVGSDIGGSIRVPAVFCGVYGHRPSETLLPRSGQFPYPPTPNSAIVMEVQGPLGRSAQDLQLALSLLAGPEVGEDVAWRVQLPPARHERLADFRVGVLPAIPWTILDDRIASTLEDLATRLGKLGCTVGRVQPEAIGDWKEHCLLYRTLLVMMTSVRLPEERRQLYLEWYRKYDSEFSRAAARALEAPPSEYVLWIGRRERYREAWRAFFRDWDVLLTPAFSTLAYPHVERPFPTDESDFTLTLTINGQPAPYMRCLVYPSIPTLAGQPATAFPAGRSKEGLPIGLQAIGPYLEDLTPIRFAALLAREIGGFAKPDGYDA